MSTLSPLQSPGFHEHRAELRRQAQRDLENAELLRARHARELQQQKGELRERERRLEEMEWRLDQERVALAAQRDAQNGSAAEDMARELRTAAVDRAFVTGNSAAIAAQIIAAGEKRRAEIGPETLPQNSQARAILLCGARRRAEQLSPADEQWLANYLRQRQQDDARR